MTDIRNILVLNNFVFIGMKSNINFSYLVFLSVVAALGGFYLDTMQPSSRVPYLRFRNNSNSIRYRLAGL